MDRGPQFPLRMSANQIIDSCHLWDSQVFDNLTDTDGYMESSEDLLKRKLRSAKNHKSYENPKSSSLFEDIKANGIIKPIEITTAANGERAVTDGHHRLAVQHHLDPDAEVIPVRHETSETPWWYN